MFCSQQKRKTTTPQKLLKRCLNNETCFAHPRLAVQHTSSLF